MSWMDNYPDRAPARFIPAPESAPEVVWPDRGFHADCYGGYGEDNLGSRHDVLARDNPAWAAAVLAAAVAAGMPLMARRVGSAGKYKFWRLCAASPAQAEADGIRLRAERDARELARKERELAARKEAAAARAAKRGAA